MKRFVSDVSGSVAMMVGLLLLPLLIAVGMAIDYSRGVGVRAELQKASDAAALSIARLVDADDAALQVAAQDMIIANLGSLVMPENLVVTVQRDPSGRIEVMTDAVLDSYFMQFSGFPRLDAQSRSVVLAGNNTFIDIYLMLDRSESMYITRPGADMTAMMNLTRPMVEGTIHESGEPDGCAFACHSVQEWQADGISLHDHARSNGIGLRIDTVIDSATRMAETLLANAGQNIRVGVVDFSEDVVLALPPSSDVDAIRTKLGESDVDHNRSHYHNLFEFVTNTLGPQGSGATASDPLKLLVLITDGAYSQWYTDGTVRPDSVWQDTSADGVAYYEVFDPTVCADALAQGFEISVVNTIYYPLLNSFNYDNLVLPYADQIDDKLKECVTRDYLEASSTADIENAFQVLASSFQQTRLRLVE